MELADNQHSGAVEPAEASILLALENETHTLGNLLRDVIWTHPHTQLASYTQDHPSENEILFRCQTDGSIGAEQCVVESLQLTQDLVKHVGEEMEAAVARWEEKERGAERRLTWQRDDSRGSPVR